MWAVGAGAGPSDVGVRGNRSMATVLRSMGPMLSLGFAATLGLALGVALARVVETGAGPVDTARSPRRGGDAADPDPPPESERRKRGRAGLPRSNAVRERGDGGDRHTRRWAERRTTAGGRRSTIGPLIDHDSPASPVRVRNGNGPTVNGVRHRPVSGHRSVATPRSGRFGPHRIGPYDVECVRATLPDQLADREVGGLGRPVPRRTAPALVERDETTSRRFHDILDQLSRGASVGVAVGEDEQSGGETVTPDVRHLPRRAALGGQLGGQRAAEERAAAIPLAVGAHKHHRFAGVRLPETEMVSGSRGGEIQPERGSRVGDDGGADPGTAGSGVREEQPTPGGAVKVGMAPGPTDESNAHASTFCRGFQGPADVRVEVAVRQRLGSPWTGLLDQQPGLGGGCCSGERFGRFEGSGSACAHKGEPNPEGHARNAGRTARHATTSGGGLSCLRYSGIGHGGRRLRRRPERPKRRRPTRKAPNEGRRRR